MMVKIMMFNGVKYFDIVLFIVKGEVKVLC